MDAPPIPPDEELRDRAISVLTDVFTQAGCNPDDAGKAAARLVDESGQTKLKGPGKSPRPLSPM